MARDGATMMASSRRTTIEALEDLGRDWAEDATAVNDGERFADVTQWRAYWLAGSGRQDVSECLLAVDGDMPIDEALNVALDAGWRALPRELKPTAA
jgi:hypothetical protein